jgi:hypothetical protein
VIFCGRVDMPYDSAERGDGKPLGFASLREHETKKESGDNQPKFHHERLRAIVIPDILNAQH